MYPLMDRTIPYSVAMPQRVAKDEEESTVSATAKLLGANLEALMKAHPDLSSNPKLSKKTKLSTSTISRLRNGGVEATMATLEVLSAAFHVEPWQLLVAGIDPGNLPVLMSESEAERKLRDHLRELLKEMRETAR